MIPKPLRIQTLRGYWDDPEVSCFLHLSKSEDICLKSALEVMKGCLLISRKNLLLIIMLFIIRVLTFTSL
jgi:hypothetical protein